MVGDIRNLMPLGLVTLTTHYHGFAKDASLRSHAGKMLPETVSRDQGDTTFGEIPVSEKIAGRQVHELNLPDGVLITMNVHRGKTQTVNGNARI